MSVMIESTEELLALLKKMDLKVTSIDELRQLLATIHANYNPDAARQKTGKQIGTVVPGIMAGAAAFASFFLLITNQTEHSIAQDVGGLAVIWGAVSVVSTAAVLAAAIMTSVRRGRTMSDPALDRQASRTGPVVTHITRELPS